MTGSIKVKNNSETNLETLNTVNVHVYDEAGREPVVPVVWEAEQAETDCIKIHNNKMTASKVGIYRIRASYEELVSDWIEVTVEEE